MNYTKKNSPRNIENQHESSDAGYFTDNVYANILLHEFFWHGFLGKVDNKYAKNGSLESTNAFYSTLLDLSPYRDAINKKIN
ncbi:MAG: hypothetical protein LBQ54_02480 [Planctomycetaceae bacterium]|jgi:hypothetical protein|nr:hypothetical protein [Planctomycetaceae bacterium]